MFTRQVNVQIGKTLFEIQTLICGYRLWREQNNFPSSSCVIRRVLFIFPQEVDGAEPSETDIEMLIWAPICLNTINGKSKNSTIDIPYLEKVIVSSEGIELEETESYIENKYSCSFFHGRNSQCTFHHYFVRGPTQKSNYLRTMFYLGTILVCFLVLSDCFSGCLQNNSQANQGWWIQKKWFLFGQGAQEVVLCPDEYQGQFPCHSTFSFPWHLNDVSLLIFRSICEPCLVASVFFLLNIVVDGC